MKAKDPGDREPVVTNITKGSRKTNNQVTPRSQFKKWEILRQQSQATESISTIREYQSLSECARSRPVRVSSYSAFIVVSNLANSGQETQRLAEKKNKNSSYLFLHSFSMVPAPVIILTTSSAVVSWAFTTPTFSPLLKTIILSTTLKIC